MITDSRRTRMARVCFSIDWCFYINMFLLDLNYIYNLELYGYGDFYERSKKVEYFIR